jgi:iron complex transport system substrate-binding protein
MARARIPVFNYEHAGLADVSVTIRRLGERVGRSAEASRVVRQIEAKMEEIRTRVAERPRPKTLLVFARDANTLRGIYASGGVGFLHDMLTAAGGENVFADVQRQAVQATSELVLARRPDVILEIRGGEMPPEEQKKQLAMWNALPAVPAVRRGRVFMITDQRTVVPGPRVAEGTELIARALHPEAFGASR